MARFQEDKSRLNYTVEQSGREYNLRLLQRSQAIFSTLLNLLPSNYVSAVEGPNYTLELKAVAVEFAKLELALEDVDRDRVFETTRSDFLYSIFGHLILVNGRLPPLEFSDEEFRAFLLTLLSIYFQGSLPKSMQDLGSGFIRGDITVKENFLLVRQGATGLDISDQYGFSLETLVPPGSGFPIDGTNVEVAIRMFIDVVRPAHTLFKLRYIFQDTYLPNDTLARIIDTYTWAMCSYYYDDTRSYWAGIHNQDRLGRKINQLVVDEDHGADF